MKKILLVLALLLVSFAAYSQNSYHSLADSLRYVVNVPYIQNCSDPILWKVVGKGLDIVPDLIDKLDDTTVLKEVYVPFFGGEYAVADVAHIALLEIIRDIPTFELLGVEFDEKGCGYCSYWFHVRSKVKNRKRFKEAVRKWYNYHKNYLEWTEGNGMSNTGDCFKPLTLKGHYRVKKTDEDFLAEVFLKGMNEKSDKRYIHKRTSFGGSNASCFEDSISFVKNKNGMPEEYFDYSNWYVIAKDKFRLKVLEEFAEYMKASEYSGKSAWDVKTPAFWSDKYKNLIFIDSNKVDKDVWKRGYMEVSLPAFSRNGEYAIVTVGSYTPYINGILQVSIADHVYKREGDEWIEIAYRVKEIS